MSSAHSHNHALAAIPELLEAELGESIGGRTASLATFRELGPPDLVHLTKSNKQSGKKYGTYHFVTGLEASSSASLAAYLTTLTYIVGENQIWFGKPQPWKITAGVYCCYNVFSKVDLRVRVEIPGSVEAYTVDSRGTKKPATDELWQETFVSALVRAILYTEDDNNYITGCRRLSPLADIPTAQRVYAAFQALFLRGPVLGAAADVQVPTCVSNYLVDAFLRYTELTGQYDSALEVLNTLLKVEPALVTLIAQVYLLQGREVSAVQLMHDSIAADPQNADMLLLQAGYVLEKGRADLALAPAVQAVNLAPSEFRPWAVLARVYTALRDYENALLTLNSCPMYGHKENDVQKIAPPAKVHLPLPADGMLDEVWDVNAGTAFQESVDQALLKLPAPSLRSTFAKAYELLTEIVAKIGWDVLLKYRSNVFVMEEEYRKEKVGEEIGGVESPGITVEESSVGNGAEGSTGSSSVANGKPKEDKSSDTSSSLRTNASRVGLRSQGSISNSISETFKNKRLCERWLDNLFMVLYEDLRVFAVWRAEMQHYEAQQLQYRKNAIEWEILGMTAFRLHHYKEAAEAFNSSLAVRFSHRVTWKLFEYYQNLAKHNRKQKVLCGPQAEVLADAFLDCIVKLTAWNHRWYTEFSPKLLLQLKELVAEEGMTKVKSKVLAKYSPQKVVDLMDTMFEVLKRFRFFGTEQA